MQYFKKYISLILLIVATHSKAAIPDSLLWIQQPAISPDGQWIAFEYKGGLYKVSSSGGAAIPLTINKAYNGYPKWSHDGSQIAFASDRYGNFDVFIMSSAGGEATRLTYSSSKGIPCDFSKDDREVYYETNRHDVYTSVRFPDDDTWLKLFAVPAKGGRSVMINSAGTEFVNFNQAGNKFLFQDRKGYENAWRKHQISPIARDIWMYDMVNKSYTKLTDFKGEDREPVWGNGNAFYYLSERNGNQNIFGSSLENPSFVRQLTTFTQNPVRNLSRSDNGMLAFTQDGELFTLEEGKAPQKILVTLPADFNHQEIENIAIKGAGKEMSVSPNGKEIAFVYRGDVFVVSASGSETKQITHTAKQERMVNFSPDGRNILYAVENEGSWDIYKATIANSNEPYFYAATTINTEPVIATPKDEFQGTYSPDGKNIAYLEDGEILNVSRPEIS
jgi:tricorn protease